jgi:putative SOS response-associated peptidase YedK
MAGCYKHERNSKLTSFVILTRPASESIAGIHDRMPVIIPKHLANDWLHDSHEVMDNALTDLSFGSEDSQLSLNFG